MRRLIPVVLLVALAAPLWGQTPAAATVIYVVRHGETEGTPAQLSAAGRQRAQDLLATLKSVRFTHAFASHTQRARQMAEVIAQAQRMPLPVVQVPRPGTVLSGMVVGESTPTAAAARPLAEALKGVPHGSTVFVAGNSDNVYAILNDLGVPLCGSLPAGNPADNCIPCRDASCYGNVYDRLFMLRLAPGQPVRLAQMRYGARSAP